MRLNTDPNLTPNPIWTHDRARAPNPNRQNYVMGLETGVCKYYIGPLAHRRPVSLTATSAAAARVHSLH